MESYLHCFDTITIGCGFLWLPKHGIAKSDC